MTLHATATPATHRGADTRHRPTPEGTPAMKRILPAALATLALALTACSDPSEAYTPVDDLPSANDPAASPPTTTTPPPTPIDDTTVGDPVDRVDPVDPSPVPTDPEVPPPMDPVPPTEGTTPRIDDATRPPPVDPTMEDEDPAPPTP